VSVSLHGFFSVTVAFVVNPAAERFDRGTVQSGSGDVHAGRSLCRRGDVHADGEHVRAAAENHAFQRADVAEVAAPGDGDVLVVRDGTVRRIEIDVPEARASRARPMRATRPLPSGEGGRGPVRYVRSRSRIARAARGSAALRSRGARSPGTHRAGPASRKRAA